MKRMMLITMAMLGAGSLQAQQCDAEHIRADYQITQTTQHSQTPAKQIQLWRNGPHQVAKRDMQHHISDVWQQFGQGQVRLVRYFEQAQRAIEYQPDELGQSIRWQQQYQWISDADLQQLTLKSTQGTGCDTEMLYQGEIAGAQIRLLWLPQYRLIKQLQRNTSQFSEQWQLQSLSTDQAVISAQFQRLDQFQTTDYADIGDNESDPFLSKLINQGFVQHGGSGFYNAQGQMLEGHHHH